MPVNPRTKERIMLAASTVQTANDREAAIVGGIVGTLLNTGHMDPNYIGHHTIAALEWAEPIARDIHNSIIGGTFRYVPGGKPTEIEVRDMVVKFRDAYYPQEPKAA